MLRNAEYYKPVLTKVEMLAALNDLFRRFYGGNTRLAPKVQRWPKDKIWQLYNVLWLWRNDDIAKQVLIVEDWIVALSH